MLVQLFRKGPYTVGIFRKSANARVVKEIREKLDSGLEVSDSADELAWKRPYVTVRH